MKGITEIVLSSAQFLKAYQTFLSTVSQKYNLSNIELDVMLFLANNPSLDTAKDIVIYRRIAKSYVSKGIDLLIKKELLNYTIDDKDHRIVHLSITEAAQPIVQEGQKAQQAFVEMLHKNISMSDLETVSRCVNQMNQNIKEFL